MESSAGYQERKPFFVALKKFKRSGGSVHSRYIKSKSMNSRVSTHVQPPPLSNANLLAEIKPSLKRMRRSGGPAGADTMRRLSVMASIRNGDKNTSS